eukprot:CAMPEP_0175857976 /NCGR_PEP_ID=MMETSP0107_2-20121207/29394_1 /TAXON_ID=195067 ORGANISM="Goniomonas pacifica, Strain CCMP1869" /NCGR_SAMPLE_ID=MMETSP0107_2 /ASSEMBLY_ACC=CAM_ASM_000203 /LENGTH=744 /DNA_ID=CAMNT_0017174335 /DNA_START=498 /DNA_END=2730 /DNA_ORIENTATION=+
MTRAVVGFGVLTPRRHCLNIASGQIQNPDDRMRLDQLGLQFAVYFAALAASLPFQLIVDRIQHNRKHRPTTGIPLLEAETPTVAPSPSDDTAPMSRRVWQAIMDIVVGTGDHSLGVAGGDSPVFALRLKRRLILYVFSLSVSSAIIVSIYERINHGPILLLIDFASRSLAWPFIAFCICSLAARSLFLREHVVERLGENPKDSHGEERDAGDARDTDALSPPASLVTVGSSAVILSGVGAEGGDTNLSWTEAAEIVRVEWDRQHSLGVAGPPPTSLCLAVDTSLAALLRKTHRVDPNGPSNTTDPMLRANIEAAISAAPPVPALLLTFPSPASAAHFAAMARRCGCMTSCGICAACCGHRPTAPFRSVWLNRAGLQDVLWDNVCAGQGRRVGGFWAMLVAAAIPQLILMFSIFFVSLSRVEVPPGVSAFRYWALFGAAGRRRFSGLGDDVMATLPGLLVFFYVQILNPYALMLMRHLRRFVTLQRQEELGLVYTILEAMGISILPALIIYESSAVALVTSTTHLVVAAPAAQLEAYGLSFVMAAAFLPEAIYRLRLSLSLLLPSSFAAASRRLAPSLSIKTELRSILLSLFVASNIGLVAPAVVFAASVMGCVRFLLFRHRLVSARKRGRTVKDPDISKAGVAYLVTAFVVQHSSLPGVLFLEESLGVALDPMHPGWKGIVTMTLMIAYFLAMSAYIIARLSALEQASATCLKGCVHCTTPRETYVWSEPQTMSMRDLPWTDPE